ncbi:CHASE domain-containing protein [Deinococcus fonticola]|uniref:CHASE domain-containing protein n=1 Tax=Deinococcus fonticola TaxID=2528713 RepID=UPI001F115528|nr:CHASE domain-containing protein [Deinococcus fonticola]
MKPAILPQRLPPLLRSWGRLIPLLVMALVLLLSVLLAAVVGQFTHEQQRVRFEREATAYTTALQGRVSDFDKLLQASRAFWMANPTDVTPQNFARFTQELKLTERYPDVLALGYNAWLPAGQESTLETLVSSLGLRGYNVFPETTSQRMRAPIVLIAPLDAANRAAQGYDMYVEPSRRAAFDEARRRGAYQVSKPVELVQKDALGRPYQGFLVVLPVWREDVGDAAATGQLTGYLYLAVRADLFLDRLTSAFRVQGISSSVRLGGVPLVSRADGHAEFRQTDRLELAGQGWVVQYAAPGSFGRDIFGLVPYLILLAGMFLAALAYRLMQSQVYARERAELVNQNLSELQVKQERARAEFEAIFQSMQDAAAFTDRDGHILMVNRAMNRQFRYPRGELEGQALSSLHADRRLDSTLTFQSLTTPYRRRDQSLFQGEAQRSEVRDQKGEVFGLLEVVRDVSERVQSEQALQAEERRSRAVLDAIPHILWVSDPGGQVTYTNAAHRRRLGTATVRERVHPHDLAAYDQMWQDAYTLRTRSQAELRLQVGPAGLSAPATVRERWFEVRVAPLLDDAGQAQEWVASATDIHDRLVAERLSQRNEARYRGVLEGMPQIVWLADPEGELTYFNRRWEEYVGEERGTFLPTVHPDDRADYQQRWLQAVRRVQPFEAEHRLLGADGLYRTFVTRGLPVRDAQGQVIEWVGTSTDVDDSVYAEMSARLLADISTALTARVNDPLAKRAAKYQAVLELVTQRMAVAGAIWTAPHARLLASVQQDPNWSLPHIQTALHAAVQQVMRTEETQDIQAHPLLHVVAASGAVATPLIGLDGTLLGVLGLAYRHELHDRDHELVMEVAKRLAESLDNDDLRAQALEAEAELLKLNQSLEERVQRRTMALEEANRELEAFSYSVSHDLRTPLRHVVGFGDLLRKESADTLGSKGTRYLNVITEAAARMNTLIDSLLEFSRMGRAQMKAAPVDLRAVIQNAWEHLEPDRQGRQISFELCEMPTIDGDANLLDLVFQNLLSNAIKYTRTRPAAHVRVTSEVHDGRVTVRVRDDGVGFDPKYADKLFGVFQRLHRSDEFDGTGIGLANVRRIVTRHGGSVDAQSVLGEGSVFSVTLPLHSPEPLE